MLASDEHSSLLLGGEKNFVKFVPVCKIFALNLDSFLPANNSKKKLNLAQILSFFHLIIQPFPFSTAPQHFISLTFSLFKIGWVFFWTEVVVPLRKIRISSINIRCHYAEHYMVNVMLSFNNIPQNYFL
jgi:hypothetical protein